MFGVRVGGWVVSVNKVCCCTSSVSPYKKEGPNSNPLPFLPHLGLLLAARERLLLEAARHEDVADERGREDAGVEVEVVVVVAVHGVVGDPGVGRRRLGDDDVERAGHVRADGDLFVVVVLLCCCVCLSSRIPPHAPPRQSQPLPPPFLPPSSPLPPPFLPPSSPLPPPSFPPPNPPITIISPTAGTCSRRARACPPTPA